MATPHDGLAKEILELLLHEHGTVETEVEAPSLVSQRADVLFLPDPKHDAARRTLGLLGRMSDEACLFEPFHEAPSLDEVVSCLRKLLNHRHARTLKQKRAAERSWLLCAGRPDTAISALHVHRMTAWPRGFYALPALELSVVVLSELPPTDDTLALRLMGARATFDSALEDLRARYGVVPRGGALYEACGTNAPARARARRTVDGGDDARRDRGQGAAEEVPRRGA
jgi:hypothetical protein